MKGNIEDEDFLEMGKACGLLRLHRATLCVNREHISESDGECCIS